MITRKEGNYIMANKVKVSIWKNFSFYFILVFAVLVVLFSIQLFSVNVVPSKFLIPIVTILILLLILLSALQFGKKINKINKLLGKILIVILSLVLVVGNWYLFKTGSAFSRITNSDTETSVVSIVVMVDSSYQDIQDLKGKKVGTISTGDTTTQDKALKDLTNDLGRSPSTVTYKAYDEFGDDLYNGAIDAIILNEGARGMFEENHPSFDKETRIIKSYTYKTESKDLSKNVDVSSEAFNVYITGIDTYGTLATVSRSDVNIIVSINPINHQILITGIPRDYYVPQTCQGGQSDKLTHTGMFGVECTLQTVENYMDIDINYYARVNFSSLVDIVDALGGITVNSQYGFTGYTNGNVTIIPGENQLNGEQALAFVRERYSLPNGDRDRNKNQMLVIEAMIKKAISPSIITNYGSIMNAVSGSFQTNMEQNEITTFIKKQLDEMSGWDIKQIQLNGSGSTQYSPANGFNSYVMIPNDTTVQNASSLIKKINSGQMITDEDVAYQLQLENEN